MGEWLGLGLGS